MGVEIARRREGEAGVNAPGSITFTTTNKG